MAKKSIHIYPTSLFTSVFLFVFFKKCVKLTIRVMHHFWVLVGPHQRLLAEDLCIKAGVIKANSAVLVHVFCEASL